jgi:biopolymer transport protein ExbD
MKHYALVLVLAGCGKPAPSCAEATAGLVGDKAVADALAERCNVDRWPAELRTCVMAAKAAVGEVGFPDLTACTAQMSVEQRDAAARTIAATTRSAKEIEKAPPAPSKSVVIDVGEAGPSIDGKPYDDAGLDTVFRGIAKDRDTQLVFKADRNVATGRISPLMERAKAAGVTRMAIGTN